MRRAPPSTHGALLARLLLAVAAGCGSPTGDGAPEPASGAAGSGGDAGGRCPDSPRKRPSTQARVCFSPDGTTREPIETLIGSDMGVAQYATYPPCSTMKRAPGAACPPASAVCDWSRCGLTAVLASGEPTLDGDDCCYAGELCWQVNSCGRPLFVGPEARAANAVRGAAWL